VEADKAMRLLTQYLSREIYGSLALVFTSLIMLFAFFDLLGEMSDMGRGNYNIAYVLLYVLLTIPNRIYELFPVAVLIGTIFALVQMAANSELTIYRSSGASLKQMVRALLKIGLPLMIISLVCGEFIAPPSMKFAQELRLKALNAQVSFREFRSGVWVKDEKSFVNVKNVLPDTTLLNVSIYEFDDNFVLSGITSAQRATFLNEGSWKLEGVMNTHFDKQGAKIEHQTSREWRSAITPDILRVLMVVPEQMSAWNLYQYTQHLKDNKQESTRYEIEMWNKIVYPFSVMVMMLLALPFAAHQRRQGGISGKVFAGIVLGLSFYFIGRLFAHLGALNNWQPMLSASAMTVIFLFLALGMLWWTERR
jgi:lipopolysaccharide export system permease protein